MQQTIIVRKRNLKKEELREKMKRILFIPLVTKYKAALLYNRVKWLNKLNEKSGNKLNKITQK